MLAPGETTLPDAPVAPPLQEVPPPPAATSEADGAPAPGPVVEPPAAVALGAEVVEPLPPPLPDVEPPPPPAPRLGPMVWEPPPDAGAAPALEVLSPAPPLPDPASAEPHPVEQPAAGAPSLEIVPSDPPPAGTLPPAATAGPLPWEADARTSTDSAAGPVLLEHTPTATRVPPPPSSRAPAGSPPFAEVPSGLGMIPGRSGEPRPAPGRRHHRARRSATTFPDAHSSPADIPEDAPGRVEILAGEDPLPATGLAPPEPAPPVASAPASIPAGEASVPSSSLTGWPSVAILTVVLIVVFVVGLRLTR